ASNRLDNVIQRTDFVIMGGSEDDHSVSDEPTEAKLPIIFDGRGGNDTLTYIGTGLVGLIGGDGNDTLAGGSGYPRLQGGAGDDVMNVGTRAGSGFGTVDY